MLLSFIKNPSNNIKQVFRFSSSSKYSDSNKLNNQEVNSILRKKPVKQKIMVKDKIELNASWDIPIEEQITHMKQFSKEQIQKNEIQEVTQIIEKEQNTKLQDVKYYKYGLPIPNLDPNFKGLNELIDEQKAKIQTINEQTLQVLNVNEDSSYQVYEIALQHKFNFEMDMYGSIENNQEIRDLQIQQLGNEVVPLDKINNIEYMDTMKRCFSLNINMPGSMEMEHPHRFIKDLRPIEDFPHTPLVPISDKQMREHKEMLERYHRNAFYFEVKRETIANYCILAVAAYMAFQLFKMALAKEEKRGIAYERLKLKRIEQS